jgi:hypothetical protein
VAGLSKPLGLAMPLPYNPDCETARIDWAAVDFPAVVLALMFLTDPRLDFYENTPDAELFYDLIDNMNEDTMWLHIAESEGHATV